jgi:predicted aspartyl protease
MDKAFTSSISLPSRLTLPLEFHEDIPFLRGTLDGESCLMLLDSGAPNITLNSASIPKSKLSPAGELMGAAGKLKSFHTRIEELRFGDWKMGPIEVLALDEEILGTAFKQSFHGLIGFRQLIHYDWMVDYKTKELHLWANFHKKEHAVTETLRIRYLNHLPLLQAMVGEHEFHFLLDTGCAGLVMHDARREILDEVVEWGEDDEVQGAGGLKVTASTGVLNSYSVGGIEFRDTTVKVSNLAHLQNRIGPFDGIIGYPLLSQKRTVVSWEQRRLFFLEDQ